MRKALCGCCRRSWLCCAPVCRGLQCRSTAAAQAHAAQHRRPLTQTLPAHTLNHPLPPLANLAGAADPTDGFPYPLVVQDRDLRTLLEIKPPAEGALPGGELAVAVATAAAAAAPGAAADGGEGGGGGIIVPTVRELDVAERPDSLVLPPVVQRMQDGGATEQPDVAGSSPAARAATAAWHDAKAAVAADPPYIRYVQVCVLGAAVGWLGHGIVHYTAALACPAFAAACLPCSGPPLLSFLPALLSCSPPPKTWTLQRLPACSSLSPLPACPAFLPAAHP